MSWPPGRRSERLWRCDCGHDHFLSVLRYDDEGRLSLVDGTNCRSLTCRIKAAWSVLRTGGGFGHYGIEIILTPETVSELIAELGDQAITAKLGGNSRYQAALRDADAESWDGPGVSVEAMIEAADERRGAASRQADPPGCHLAYKTIDQCRCECHATCSCDLGFSVASWKCARHERHCEECAP